MVSASAITRNFGLCIGLVAATTTFVDFVVPRILAMTIDTTLLDNKTVGDSVKLKKSKKQRKDKEGTDAGGLYVTLLALVSTH